MKLTITLFFSLILTFKISAQEELAPLPEPITNNAVAAWVDDDHLIWLYTFGGMDSTNTKAGAHKRCFRYNPNTEVWETLPDLPSGPARIGASASVVNDKIYIIGGNEINPINQPKSINKVNVFNPRTNQFEADGADIPAPLSDHVQAEWRDSLIYLLAGWGESDLSSEVQIYNPGNNTWLQGQNPGIGLLYNCFGASGTIKGDTIYYFGGTMGFPSYTLSPILRTGIINPNDPTEIEWSIINDPRFAQFRGAVCPNPFGFFWVGGSDLSYDLMGRSYSAQAAKPLNAQYQYSISGGLDTINFWNNGLDFMDSRGFAYATFEQTGGYTYFAQIGGMNENAKVTNRVFSSSIAITSSKKIPSQSSLDFAVFPNPAKTKFTLEFSGKFSYSIYNMLGQLLEMGEGIDQANVSIQRNWPHQVLVKLSNEKGEHGSKTVLLESQH
jgi:hypothetical protein